MWLHLVSLKKFVKFINCVLLYLTQLFCKPGQEERKKLLHILSNEIRHKTIKRYPKSILTEIDLQTGQIDPQHEFNAYFELMYAMKSEITEDGLSIGETESHHEFLLKLCYCEKLCNEHDDDDTYRKFLRKNADFLATKIGEVVGGNNTKTKLISCKVLLCLVKWDLCNQKTAYTHLNNILSQMLSQKEECQDFMNENALFFVSMVRTVIKRNNIPLLINFCDVLLCISDIELHFYKITGAVNKLIRYYIKQVGTNEKILQVILLLGYRILKHLNDNQNIDTDMGGKLGLKKFCKLLEELSSDSRHERNGLDLLIKALNNGNRNKYWNYVRHLGMEQDALKQECSCKGELKDMLNSCDTRNGLFTENYSSKLENSGYSLFGMLEPNFFTRSKGDFFNEQDVINTDHSQFPLMFEPSSFTRLKRSFFNEWGDINTEYSRSTLNHIHNSFTRGEGNFLNELVDKYNTIRIKMKDIFVNMLALIMMVCMVWTLAGHNSSAKLEKYLTLKHHYPMASLYLLWCSGDIEVHPGPCNRKKTDSSIMRIWIPYICKMLYTKLPEGVKLIYREIKGRLSDEEYRSYLENLLEACLEKKVHVPKMYQAEINARKNTDLLNILLVYRHAMETIIVSLKDFFTFEGSTKDLNDINVSIITELKTNKIPMVLGKDLSPKDISQMVAHITRHLAGISIKSAYNKDTAAKCDGLWDKPLENWSKDKILFDPNNRGKYSKKYPGKKLIPDQELVDLLLRLPNVIKNIPQKYEKLVDAFRTMRRSQKDKSINNQHKAELCSTFKRITSLGKLDDALKNLWESGIFTEELHTNLNKWWTTGTADTTDDQNFSQIDIKDAGGKERPHIAINISTQSITLSVEPTCPNRSQVTYDFPFKDELVPLKRMDSTVHQTTIQKPSIDSNQKVTAKKCFTVSPKQDACPTDNQTNSIIFPPAALKVLNTLFPCHLYPDSQAILEIDIKHQHEMSSQETALPVCSIHLDQPTFSTNQISQLNQNIAILGQPDPIFCTPNQSTTNSNDTSSATIDSQSLDFHTQVCPLSDMGSSDSISSVNSESGNDEGDQINIPNGRQVLLTDSDYSSDSSYNCLSTNTKKRKCTEEKKTGMKKRRKTSPKQGKEQTETHHTKTSASTDTSTIFNTNMELLLEGLNNDIDSFKVSTELEMFIQDMINSEVEKMSQMKSYLSDV